MATLNSNTRKGTLAAPFEHITVEVSRWYLGVEVFYREGRPTELIAAGVVTPGMVEQIASKKHGARNDDQGRKFRIRREKHRTQAAAWLSGDPIEIYYATRGDDSALSLPGVRELYPEGVIPEWKEPESPRRASFLSRALSEVSDACRNLPVREHQRNVGRFQRPVEYVTVGPLVIPNWVKIKAAVTLMR